MSKKASDFVNCDMNTERICVDNVIDRFYVRFRKSYEPNELIDIITEHVGSVFTFQNFNRSYVRERVCNLLNYQEQLKNLSALPVLEQRSPEWYKIRQNLITASDFAQALGDGKFGNQKQFFQKKCGYEKDTFDNSMPALKWGVKYEPVAIDAYAKKNKMKMYEFGLLIHPEKKWFGASPDSITELGIMVEIKCPWKRRITGEVPKQYYYQIQGQLDVCKLQECDFLECEFVEYDCEEEFIRHYHDNTNEKGVILEYFDTVEKKDAYFYSPMKHSSSLDDTLKWLREKECEMSQKGIPKTRTYYWQLHTYSVVRVYKDEEFLSEKFPMLKGVWDQIQVFKKDKSAYDAFISPQTQANAKTTFVIEEIDLETPIPRVKSCGKNAVSFSGYAFLSDDEGDE